MKEAIETLDAGLEELRQVDKLARRQLAVMRWQHARAVLSGEHKHSLIRLPSAKTSGALQQVRLMRCGFITETHGRPWYLTDNIRSSDALHSRAVTTG